jgi:hypothetical protein
VRYEDCLTCLLAGQVPGLIDEEQRVMLAATEDRGPFTHHHHTIRCGLCGQWWFDDTVRGPLGLPAPARRDTQLCDCPEGEPVFTKVAVTIPVPEAACACMLAEAAACDPARIMLFTDGSYKDAAAFSEGVRCGRRACAALFALADNQAADSTAKGPGQ